MALQAKDVNSTLLVYFQSYWFSCYIQSREKTVATWVGHLHIQPKRLWKLKLYGLHVYHSSK